MSSFQVPREVARAAKILLDNDSLVVVLRHRMQELAAETMSYAIPDEILAAHRDYQTLEHFAEWLKYAAEQAE